MNWKPSETDLMWCQNLVNIIKNGGAWGTSAGIYKLHHETKTMTLIYKTGIPGTYEGIHLKNIIAFKVIGWQVIDGNMEKED
jgi:hypothetical protein